MDGISLTIVDLLEDSFTVAVIPQTYRDTALAHRRPGDLVNLESDMIGKYVLKAMGAYQGERKGGLTEGFLRQTGFLEG